MTSSAYLALIFGAYIVAVAIPMLWNPMRLVSLMDDLIESPPLIFLIGVLAMTGGLSVIAFHNIWFVEVWCIDWRVFITILGWLAAIEGALLIIAPGPLLKIARKILHNSNALLIFGFIYLCLGAFLISRAFH
ncbi:MAG: hypothetical protein ABJO36_12210 [Litorimonas sp.]